jgi:hypothetical protein
MARYVGGAVLTAVVAGIYASVPTTGAGAADALAAGLSRSSIVLAVFSALGIVLGVLVARKPPAPQAVDYAAAAAGTVHTIPTRAQG